MPEFNPLSMLMFVPTHTCVYCGMLLEYWGVDDWRDNNENELCDARHEPKAVNHAPGSPLTAAEKTDYYTGNKRR